MPGEAAAPERNPEDGLHRRCPLLSAEKRTIAQEPVDLPFRRRPVEHAPEDGNHLAGAQGVPGNVGEPLERIHPAEHRQDSSSSQHRVVYQVTIRTPRPVQLNARMITIASVDDPRDLLEAGRFEDLAHDDHPLWRGLALLELTQPRLQRRLHLVETLPPFFGVLVIRRRKLLGRVELRVPLRQLALARLEQRSTLFDLDEPRAVVLDAA